MAQVQHRLRIHLARRRRHDEIALPFLKRPDDLRHLGRFGVGHRRDLTQLRHAPGQRSRAGLLAQAKKELLRDPLLALTGQRGPRFLQMLRERVGESAHLFIITEEQDFFRVPAPQPRLRRVPGAHQPVLHEREQVGVGAGVVEDLVDQVRCGLRAKEQERFLDDFLHLPARQARHEELAVADRLRQAGENVAVARGNRSAW